MDSLLNSMHRTYIFNSRGQHSDCNTTRTHLFVWTSLSPPSQLHKSREETGSNIIENGKVGSLLTAAARSNCPPTAGGFFTPGLEGTDREAPVGRWVLGIGGLPGIFGGPPLPPDTFGFEATGGGPGFGFVATGGGGLLANEEFGLELAGELSVEFR